MDNPFGYDVRTQLTDELYFIVKMINNGKDIAERVFFFGAAAEALDIAARLNDNHSWQVFGIILRDAHAQLSARLKAINKGDTTIPLDDKMLDEIAIILEDAISEIRNNKKPIAAAERVTALAYQTTASGYYLNRLDKHRKLRT